MKYTYFTFLILLIFSCKEEESYYENEKIDLIDRITVFNNSNNTISFNFGMWMFSEKQFEVNAIADWIGVKKNGKTILEPINIIWVDFRATNKNEAIENITTFLNDNGFLLRNGSSIGYYGLFDSSEWIHQYKETWSDNQNPNTINNHGRIFLSHQLKSNLNNAVFISKGAFSIEDQNHYLISFDDALKKIDKTGQWQIFKNRFISNNIIQNNDYSTYDHKGIKVFVLN